MGVKNKLITGGEKQRPQTDPQRAAGQPGRQVAANENSGNGSGQHNRYHPPIYMPRASMQKRRRGNQHGGVEDIGSHDARWVVGE